MKRSLLPWLKPPDDVGAFELVVEREEGGEVMEGWLVAGEQRYPIRNGVPRLLPESLDKSNWETARRFGEEWNQFDMMTDEYETQFLSWIEPVKPEFFSGKTVLDLGCGKGRHILQSKKFGAKEVIGVDMSHAVDAAFANVGRQEGVHIIQGDIYHLPLKPASFDYGYSIGVLHHTPDPRGAFLHLVETVKPGGSVSAWVYGREGNGWIIYLLNPFRRLTSKLPLPITKMIAFVFAVILQAALVILYRPASSRPRLARLLPYSSYLCSISRYSFRENFSIVFDHLLPEIAFYIREEAFRSWFDDAGLSNPVITRRYNNSWRGFATKSGV
ncbi:class I SAM-dependent methyltransferase [Candidatus Uhrbacteria bacterium]|nr:MAG: class I SAM-dependent methyltransferase [Candidatus Uhrbacteria bacterium]